MKVGHWCHVIASNGDAIPYIQAKYSGMDAPVYLQIMQQQQQQYAQLPVTAAQESVNLETGENESENEGNEGNEGNREPGVEFATYSD